MVTMTNASDLQALQKFLTEMFAGRPRLQESNGRVPHHASSLRGLVLAITGGIVWRAVPGTVMHNEANCCWFNVGGRRHCILFSHQRGDVVELRRDTRAGTLLATLYDTTPAIDVFDAFAAL